MRPRSCMAFDGKTSLSAQERTRTLTFCSERLRSFYGERIRRVQGFRISSVIPEDDFRGILWIAVFWNELPHPYLATEKLEENSMQMETENGNLVGSAIRAILEMQSDCIKLFHDLDNKFELNGLQAISGNTVTTELGSSLTSPGLYLATYLYTLYAPQYSKHHILGVNICFHNQGSKEYFAEPLFIAANIQYDLTQADEPLAIKSWDPWLAILVWNSDKSLGNVLDVSPRRSAIKKILVVAVPLYSITSIEAAIETIDLVGHPGSCVIAQSVV